MKAETQRTPHILGSQSLPASEALLDRVLRSEGIQTNSWGTGSFRPLSDLAKEISEGKSSFRLVRECGVIRLDVRYDHPERGPLKLFEIRQEFFVRSMPKEDRLRSEDFEIERTRHRASPFAVWEKYAASDENIEQAKGRALREELGLDGPHSFEGGNFVEEWEAPQDYPVVDTLLRAEQDVVWLTAEQFQDRYTEIQDEKQSVFEWHSVETDWNSLRPVSDKPNEPNGSTPARKSSLRQGIGLKGDEQPLEQLSVRELAGQLVKREVPVDTEWGRDQAKTTRHLHEELFLGESTLPLLRYCSVVRIEVLAEVEGKMYRLQEARREFVSGEEDRVAVRPDSKFAVWRRFPYGSDANEHAVSGIQQELGVSQIPALVSLGDFDEYEADIEYRGLPSRLQGHQFQLSLPTAKINSPIENVEDGIRTVYTWHPLD